MKEMGVVCSRHGDIRNLYGSLAGQLKGRDLSNYLGVGESIILNWIWRM
jgi:hypothetical protein